MATTTADGEHDAHHHHPDSFIEKYVFSQDHKVIGIQYGLVAVGTGIVGLVLSLLMRMQLAFPGVLDFIDPAVYLQSVSMHGMIMVVYLLTALLLGGFGNYLIPLMIGARDMAFPTLNMLSFWFFTVSVVILMVSFVVPGGPTGAGWTLYPPQALLQGTPGAEGGLLVLILSLAVFIVAFTMGGLNYVTTVLQMRTKGMTLMRMPLTVWGIFIASLIGLLAFPALFVAAVMMLFDLLVGTSFFMPSMMLMGEKLHFSGGSPILFQHLFWFFGHPEVYIVALPAFGLVSDIISCHARKAIFGYHMMVWAIVAIGLLSFVVWAHHMYVSGMNPYFGFFFAGSTLMIAIPTALKVYNWLLTLWQGDIHMRVPMLYAIGFMFTFLHGGLTGLFLGNVAVDVPLSDTYFVVGHFHTVMGLSPVLVVYGAIYHWFPLMTGKMLNDTLGRIHFWVTFLGGYILFLPFHYFGFNGVPRRYFSMGDSTFLPDAAMATNALVTMAALAVAAVQLVFFVNVIITLMSGKKAERNPWGAPTLEWHTPDMPPVHLNWGPSVPVVHRWAYDYSVPGADKDYVPQTTPRDSRFDVHET